MANKFHSPLRYPGGKTKLAPFIKALFYENNLVSCRYVEPFAGGAGVALSLLFDEYASTVTINDFDRSIYAFWHSIKYENKRFCRKIEKVNLDIKTWEKQKKIQLDKQNQDLFNLGFSTFYLNRTNISGIIKGGVIGGVNQLGKYKMDVRFNKAELIKRIQNIDQYKERIEVENKDALELLRGRTEYDFVYLDPPYVKKAEGLYMNFYEEDDHNKISRLLLSEKIGFDWVLSYDEDELIDRLYRSCKSNLKWKVDYGSSNRKGKESLFLSSRLKFESSKEIIQS